MGNPFSGKYNIVIEDPTVCYNCKAEGLLLSEKYCPCCGFPQNGTHEEQRDFIYQHFSDEIKSSEYHRSIFTARLVLTALATVNLVFGILAVHHIPFFAVSSIIVSLVYFLLAWWAKRKPVLSLLIALLLYVTLVSANYILFPGIFVNAWKWQLLVVFAFGYGLFDAIRYEKLKNR